MGCYRDNCFHVYGNDYCPKCGKKLIPEKKKNKPGEGPVWVSNKIEINQPLWSKSGYVGRTYHVEDEHVVHF